MATNGRYEMRIRLPGDEFGEWQGYPSKAAAIARTRSAQVLEQSQTVGWRCYHGEDGTLYEIRRRY